MIVSCFKLISVAVVGIIISFYGKSVAYDWECEALSAYINGLELTLSTTELINLYNKCEQQSNYEINKQKRTPFNEEGIRYKKNVLIDEGNHRRKLPEIRYLTSNGEDVWLNWNPFKKLWLKRNPFNAEGIRYKKNPFETEGIRYKKSLFTGEGIRYKRSPNFRDEGIRYKKTPFNEEGIRYKKTPFNEEGIRFKKSPFNEEGIRFKKSPFNEEGIRYKKVFHDGIRYRKNLPFNSERSKMWSTRDGKFRSKKLPIKGEGIRYKKDEKAE